MGSGTSPRGGEEVFWELRAPTKQPPKILPGVRLLCLRTRLALTTGTGSVATNIHFTFFPQAPSLACLTLLLLLPPPHSTSILECSLNYPLWLWLLKSTCTFFGLLSLRKKLNVGATCFKVLRYPQQIKILINFFYMMKEFFHKIYSSNSLSNTCSFVHFKSDLMNKCLRYAQICKETFIVHTQYLQWSCEFIW